MIVLDYIDLDLAFRVNQSPILMDESSFDDKRNLEKWEHSNHMSLMIMKCAISKTFKGYKFYDSTRKTNFEEKIAWFF